MQPLFVIFLSLVGNLGGNFVHIEVKLVKKWGLSTSQFYRNNSSQPWGRRLIKPQQ